jgi:lipoyl-dependent peroxiredoxin
MQILYTAEATATGEGRNGHVTTADGLLDLQLAVPKEMGGAGGAPNPELLFASGYAACFHNAMRTVARRAKISIDGSTVTARVGIGPTGTGAYGLTVALAVTLPGLERPAAEELTAKAHLVCPYSNATRGNIDVTLEVL